MSDNLTVHMPSGRVVEVEPPRSGLSDKAKLGTVRAHLDLIMSQIDYTRGACRQTDQIHMLVKADYLEAVRNALEMTK